MGTRRTNAIPHDRFSPSRSRKSGFSIWQFCMSIAAVQTCPAKNVGPTNPSGRLPKSATHPIGHDRTVENLLQSGRSSRDVAAAPTRRSCQLVSATRREFHVFRSASKLTEAATDPASPGCGPYWAEPIDAGDLTCADSLPLCLGSSPRWRAGREIGVVQCTGQPALRCKEHFRARPVTIGVIKKVSG